MELSCNKEGVNLKENKLNVNAKEFQSKQNAVAIANSRTKDQIENENDKLQSITQIGTNDLINYVEHFKTKHLTTPVIIWGDVS